MVDSDYLKEFGADISRGDDCVEGLPKAPNSCCEGGEQEQIHAQFSLESLQDRVFAGEDPQQILDSLVEAVEEGNTDALKNLGLLVECSSGFQEDLQQGAKWYRRPAEQGHASAQYKLGICLAGGWDGQDQDPKQAAKWFRKAAEQGHALAQYNLGVLLATDSVGQDRDLKEAAKWFRKAAEQGDASAQYNLGICLARGWDGQDRDLKEAAKWYRKAAEQGDALAQYNLGVLLATDSDGQDRNLKEAAEWYRKAADQGLALAQCNLGLLLQTPRGGQKRVSSKDAKEAVKWFRKAAKQEDALAQYSLGVLLATGWDGQDGNLNKAARWYQQAAEQGLALAQYNLGVLLATDSGGYYRDLKEAAEWYRKAAEQGHALAQYSLGVLLATDSDGQDRNLKEAAEWYRKAADQGLALAQYNLGRLLQTPRDGQKRVSSKDAKEAVKWFRKAAKQGHAGAQFAEAYAIETSEPHTASDALCDGLRPSRFGSFRNASYSQLVTGVQTDTKPDALHHVDFSSERILQSGPSAVIALADQLEPRIRYDKQRLADKIQAQVQAFGTVKPNSLEEGKEVARRLTELLDACGLRFRFPGTDYPASLSFANPSRREKPGLFLLHLSTGGRKRITSIHFDFTKLEIMPAPPDGRLRRRKANRVAKEAVSQ